MKAGKVLTMKAVALGVAVMFIAASCGSSDSSSGGKTKNSALCFATQEDKDAAIEAAQAELDAANATDTTSAAGGYRRPAVRSMSGDTTVPPDSTVVATDETTDTTVPSSDSTVPSDSTVVDSGPNIPMLEQALADAQNQPLCDAEGSSVENTYPPEPTSYNTTTQHVVAGDGYDLEIPEGGQWLHAEGFGDDGTCYYDDGGGVWAALVVRDSAGGIVVQDWMTVNAEGCIGANITMFLPGGSYTLFAGTGDAQGDSYDCGFPLDFNLTFGLGGGDSPAPAELPESGSTTSTTSSVPTPDTLPIEILGGGDGNTTPDTTVAGTTPDTTVAGTTPDTTVAGTTPDTTPAATTLPAVTTEAIAIPLGTSELTCDANCVTTLFESFGFTDGAITLSAGGDEVVVQYGDQSAAVKVGTRTKEIKVSAVSASGTTAEKSVEVELTSTPDLPWVAPSSVATATESNSGSSMSIYIYVLIALLILVAIGYMRRKKATETK